ncbi:MAG: hypothetical protein IJ728_14555 [Selenomonadaceae bacterium]|nr:hypothetical protein [Selenomonadaceae bacterium]MBR1730733.1 hypothetical protein [Selenomonadaceae bacterium]
MFKFKKTTILAAAMLAGTISFANIGENSFAQAATVTSTTMKNSSITNLKNDTRVFKVDKEILSDLTADSF